MPPNAFLFIVAKTGRLVNLLVFFSRTRAQDDVAELAGCLLPFRCQPFSFALACILGVDRLAREFDT